MIGNRNARIGTVIAALVLTAAVQAQSVSGGTYTVRKFVIAGGGGSPQSATYRASVTVGQAAAMVSAGGSYRLVSGFHQAKAPSSGGDILFCSGFENSPCTTGAQP